MEQQAAGLEQNDAGTEQQTAGLEQNDAGTGQQPSGLDHPGADLAPARPDPPRIELL